MEDKSHISLMVSIDKVLSDRSELVNRLMVALRHLPLKEQISIITAHISVNRLRALVDQQERG